MLPYLVGVPDWDDISDWLAGDGARIIAIIAVALVVCVITRVVVRFNFQPVLHARQIGNEPSEGADRIFVFGDRLVCASAIVRQK